MTRATDHGFMTEAEVIETWPMIPAAAIRRARRTGELTFYQFPGGPHYRPRDVEAFIEAKYRRGPPPAVRVDALPPGPATPPPNVPAETFKPARPVAPSPKGYESMEAEEKRIQQEALAKHQHKADPGLRPPTLPDHPETREEEIDRLRAEVFADRILSRRPAARRAAEAEKAAKACRKGKRVTAKPDRP